MGRACQGRMCLGRLQQDPDEPAAAPRPARDHRRRETVRPVGKGRSARFPQKSGLIVNENKPPSGLRKTGRLSVSRRRNGRGTGAANISRATDDRCAKTLRARIIKRTTLVFIARRKAQNTLANGVARIFDQKARRTICRPAS
ncbi:hypothetical protein K32_29730 [Kaistia sp. 32K]|nr:hypothetical protein K32_29730 [Kaistia sp. 32K]